MSGNCNYCIGLIVINWISQCSPTPAALTAAYEKPGASFWALLPDTEKLHHSNEELQCTLDLKVKE